MFHLHEKQNCLRLVFTEYISHCKFSLLTLMSFQKENDFLSSAGHKKMMLGKMLVLLKN